MTLLKLVIAFTFIGYILVEHTVLFMSLCAIVLILSIALVLSIQSHS